ncbi:MAG: hypothetical protein KDB03_05160 [Planctomycetales bacterium]|nr:hypothetical protein [Planctomycetales bacterium]
MSNKQRENSICNLPSLTSVNVHELLAIRREIAIVWCIEDVQYVRPDLSDVEAWAVLQSVSRNHDANFGVSWDTLEAVAESLFGPQDPSSESTE